MGAILDLKLYTALSLAGCGINYPIVDVEDGLPITTEGEVVEAVLWFCKAYDNGCETGLRVEVKKDIIPPGWAGYYSPYQGVVIAWLDGPGRNALFHEMRHRLLMKRLGTYDYPGEPLLSNGHSRRFLDMAEADKQLWRRQYDDGV